MGDCDDTIVVCDPTYIKQSDTCYRDKENKQRVTKKGITTFLSTFVLSKIE